MTIVVRHPVAVSTALSAILIGLCIGWVDRPLAELLKELIHGPWESFFKAVTNLGRAELYMVPAALFAVYGYFRRLPKVQRQGAYVFLTMLAAGAVELSTKYMVGRTRPKLWFEQGLFTVQPFSHGWAVNSFPSGHSQAAWAAMIALSVVFPRYRWGFVALATLVALSRVMLTVHWASDAVAGAWLGFAAAMVLRPILTRPLPAPASES